MAALLDQIKINLQVQRHLAQWRSKIINPTTPCNIDLAEENVRELYRIYKKSTPMILWCDSPYQLGTIPPVVLTLLQTSEWHTLAETVRKAQKQTPDDWMKTWNREWRKFEKHASALNRKINGNVRWVNKYMKSAARSKIKELMCQILLQHRSSLAKSNDLQSVDALQPTSPLQAATNVSDGGFLKRRFALRMKIEKAAHIRFSNSMQNLMLGNFDARLISNIVPQAEKLLNPKVFPDEIYEQIRKIKSSCSEFEQIAQRISNWFLSLPAINTGEGNFASMWLPHAAEFLPFALACRFVEKDFFGELQSEIDCWAYLTHAAGGYYFCPEFCFICPRPISFSVNAQQRPHNEDGPAAVWSDGYEVYSWKGIVVDPPLIQNKEAITQKKIKASRNIERRRIMIDIYGEAQFLQDSGASLIAEDEYGSLYKLVMTFDETMAMVKVRNSTPEADGTYKNYFLRVPPTTMRPKQGIAWTFGLEEQEYNPLIES